MQEPPPIDIEWPPLLAADVVAAAADEVVPDAAAVDMTMVMELLMAKGSDLMHQKSQGGVDGVMRES